MNPVSIGVVATSSVVGMFELTNGLERLKQAGLNVQVHPQCGNHHFTFAGTDEKRAEAFFEYATDPRIDVIWCARGGYGAARLLPILDEMTMERGGPPQQKLLVGYSDVTVLHEFVRSRWNWSTLHAPMPAANNFPSIVEPEWTAIVQYVHGVSAMPPWEDIPLSWITTTPARPIYGELVGGNLSLWASLAGTPYQPAATNRILFFEDLGEPYYRLDRMMTQLTQAGMLDDAAAMILGDFKDCKDENNEVFANAEGTAKKPLRRVFDEREAFKEIFGTLGEQLGIPVAMGLPVGHGPHYGPLPLGAVYRLSATGHLQLQEWEWAR
jgi:muramoyltetrapeptide carboxypeptidase